MSKLLLLIPLAALIFQAVIDVIVISHYKHALKCAERCIDGLKKENKVWGDCCYTCGYLDALRGKKPELKTKEQILAEVEEKKSADQTI